MTPTLPLEVGSARRASTAAVGVAHELVVGDAARLAGGGRGVVGIDIESLAGVEVGADGVVAAGGEAPGDLLGPRVPAGQVVDDEDPGEGAVAGGEGLVGVDLGALVAGERDVPRRREGLFGCGHGGLLFVLGGRSLEPWRRDRVRGAHYGAVAGPAAVATGMMWRRAPELSWPCAGLVVLLGGLVIVVAGGPLEASAGGAAPAVRTVVGPGHARRARRRSRSMRPATSSSPTPATAASLVVPARTGRRYGLHAADRAGPPRSPAGTAAGPAPSDTRAAWPSTRTGDVYVAEATAQRVQVVRAGSGAVGDGGRHRHGRLQRRRAGVATASELDQPTGVAVDAAGDLFIADTANCRVRVLPAAERPRSSARP